MFGVSMKPETHTPPAFSTAAQLSARWHVTTVTLRRWRKAGKLKASFLGGGVRFTAEEVTRFEREAQA
jgi:predicted site-specific integrase-resolvase